MPAKANLGRTAHICDPVARQNDSQIMMVVSLGAAGIGKGRAGPALAWPAPASRRSCTNRHAIGLTACAAATAVQQHRRYCTTRNAAPPAKALIFSAS